MNTVQRAGNSRLWDDGREEHFMQKAVCLKTQTQTLSHCISGITTVEEGRCVLEHTELQGEAGEANRVQVRFGKAS